MKPKLRWTETAYNDPALQTETPATQTAVSDDQPAPRKLNSNSVGVSGDRRIIRGLKIPNAEYIKNRISKVVNLTSEEATRR